MKIQDISWNQYPEVAHHPVARAFVEALVKRQKRPKTVDAYARNLDDLIATFERHDLPLIEASDGEIDTYIDDLHQRPPSGRRANITPITGRALSDATIQQRLVTARLFFDFCIHRRYRSAQTNPVARGEYGRGGSRPVRGLLPYHPPLAWIPDDGEWERFVRHVLRSESARNRAMILLAYDGALRRQELVSLCLRDIDWSAGLITIRPETTKSGRQRVVTFSSSTERLLTRYVQDDRRQLLAGFGGEEAGPLFLSESQRNPGRPIAIGTFNDVIERLRGATGLPFKTHTFRHLRCTVLKRGGVDLQDIALYAGHRTVASTEIYIHMAPSDVSRRIRAATAPFDARMARLIEEVTHGDDR